MLFKYVAGNNIRDVLSVSNKLFNKNYIPIINYITENQGKNTIKTVFSEYNRLIDNLNHKYYIALKLSSFNFNTFMVEQIAEKCIKKDIKLIVDAENNSLIEKYRDSVNNMISKYNRDNKLQIIKTYQMYRKDSYNKLLNDIKFFNDNNIKMGVKLVRGAYFYSEKHLNVLYNKKFETDLNYNKSILTLNDYNIKTILATHNNESINLGILLNNNNNLKNFEFAHLLDMHNKKYDNIKYDQTVNVYIPYGPYNEMLPYLIRRLYENFDNIKYMIK